jgi:hypothetical protein
MVTDRHIFVVNDVPEASAIPAIRSLVIPISHRNYCTNSMFLQLQIN